MANPRAARVADQMQRELAEILRNEMKDPRVGMITITGIDVTSDLSHAKIFFTTLAEGADRKETLTTLRRAAGFLRSQLGRRLTLRTTPELHFEFDASVERGVALSQLIDRAVSDGSTEPE